VRTIRRLLIGPYGLVEPWLQHPSWSVRRAAQAGVLVIATAWLALSKLTRRSVDPPERVDEFIERLESSAALREFLQGPGVLRRPLSGRVFRELLFRLSTAPGAHRASDHEHRNFTLRVGGPIDQAGLRNLVIWQNRLLPPLVGDDDPGEIDLALLLRGAAADEPRLSELVSVVLMLERVRSFALLWEGQGPSGGTPAPQSAMGGDAVAAADLTALPREVVGEVERNGGCSGIRMLAPGRRRANDFVKLALPRRFVIAVALRERFDGSVEPGELAAWLDCIDRQQARQADVGFVLLNRVAPSEWRDWPAYLRCPRHQGLTLQDALCLAQVADGYLGVLDVFGLAARSAGRPGVYVAIEEDALAPTQSIAGARQTVLGCRDRVAVEQAVADFLAARAFEPWSQG